MKKVEDGSIQLSATDLAHRSACAHLTELEKHQAEGSLERPIRHDPALDLLIERGRRHEAAVLDELRGRGLQPVELDRFPGESSEERCAAAMQAGEGLIHQAPLGHGRWRGHADFLIKAEGRSELGDWLYEIADAKLTRETKGASLLQLLVYAALVEVIQGVPPARVFTIKPGDRPVWEEFRVSDYSALFRRLKGELERQIDQPSTEPYPVPVEHCDVCAWWSRCDRRRRDDDHLSLVAGLQTHHCEELERQDVLTVEAFADRASALDERPTRGQRSTYERLHRQAQIQVRGRRSGRPEYEFNDTDAGRGFERLPEPSPGDIYFDLEADRFFDDGGLEYLFGYGWYDNGGGFQYHHRWAMNRAQERAAFEAFVDHVMDRWARFPELHIYHFGQYEPAAVKRLTGRFATREAEVDRLLRGERFVDLHAVTKEGVRASVEQYSLKDLEPHFGFSRSIDLQAARHGLIVVCRALELGALESIDDATRDVVEGYNGEDCEATAELHRWCEALRRERVALGVSVSRPTHGEGAAPDTVAEDERRIQELFARLTEGIPEDPEDRSDEQKARWLLAHCLGYFRREIKGAVWEKYRLMDLDHATLFEERKALTQLTFENRIPPQGRGRVPTDVYSFPIQEAELRAGKEVITVDGEKIGSIAAIDLEHRRVSIKKRRDSVEVHPEAVLQIEEITNTKTLQDALFEFAEAVLEIGVDGEGGHRAGRDLLLALPPRLTTNPGAGVLRAEREEALDAAKRLAGDLDRGVLPIQGPPGAGKTHTGARTIVELVARGYRVGVTAVSHKVIDNLLKEVVAAGRERELTIAAVHKDNKDLDREVDGVEISKEPNARILQRLADKAVVGGTAWLWASDEAKEALDYLFMDEAGQLSLVYSLAMSRCARNLVLLGDPQQLQQPQRAVHPEGADASALAHVLGGGATIGATRGLFLEKTWRLHPSICNLTSELFYDDRLKAQEGMENQAILNVEGIPERGLAMVSVSHQGNASSSDEEAVAVQQLVGRLIDSDALFRDYKGEERSIRLDDILIVAPYNAQVSLLQEKIEGGRIGTVDRFQGQSAPIVIYSMAASSVTDAPRGMEFLFDAHRFNVATSRARALCVLVASPRLLEAECRTPRQMRLANGICRFGELAHSVDL